MTALVSLPDTADPAAEPVLAQPGAWRRAGSSLRRDPVALISVLVVIALALTAVLAPVLAPCNPLHAYPSGLAADGAPVHPDGTFLLGTDPNGRDVLSRMIFGARVSLLVGVVATGLASIIGIVIGGIAGYAGGVIESVLMRLTDVVLSFPILLFCIALIAITGPSTRNVVLVIAFGYWTYLARIVRGLVLSLKEREFVTAARTLGAGHAKILWRHILPHLMPAVIVYSTLGVASSILIEASLSYLGIGVPLLQASWGQMISQGQEYFQTAQMIIVIFGVVSLAFLFAYIVPGNPARLVAGPNASPQAVASIARQLGLDRPLWSQYGTFAGRLAHGNLGTSFALEGRSVSGEIRRALPVTVALAIGGVLWEIALGIPIGIAAAYRPRSVMDRLATLGALVGLSAPPFWLGLMLLYYLAYKPGHHHARHGPGLLPGRRAHHRVRLRPARRRPARLQRHRHPMSFVVDVTYTVVYPRVRLSRR